MEPSTPASAAQEPERPEQTFVETPEPEKVAASQPARPRPDRSRLIAACVCLLTALAILALAQRALANSPSVGMMIAVIGFMALGAALWLFNEYLKVFFTR